MLTDRKKENSAGYEKLIGTPKGVISASAARPQRWGKQQKNFKQFFRLPSELSLMSQLVPWPDLCSVFSATKWEENRSQLHCKQKWDGCTHLLRLISSLVKKIVNLIVIKNRKTWLKNKVKHWNESTLASLLHWFVFRCLHKLLVLFLFSLRLPGVCAHFATWSDSLLHCVLESWRRCQDHVSEASGLTLTKAW